MGGRSARCAARRNPFKESDPFHVETIRGAFMGCMPKSRCR
jgi:hypothetical protein